MFVHQESDFQLCAYTVRTGYEHRLRHFAQIELIHTAEAAQTGQNIFAEGSLYMVLHQFYGSSAFFGIYTGVFISQFISHVEISFLHHVFSEFAHLRKR